MKKLTCPKCVKNSLVRTNRTTIIKLIMLKSKCFVCEDCKSKYLFLK